MNLLITANHQGNLHYLPRLQTALSRFKKSLEGQIFLMDTGQAWSADSWICTATENRAPYVVMDVMGYHLIFADGLTPENAARLELQSILIVQNTQTAFNDISLRVIPTLSEPVFEENHLTLDLPPHGTFRHLRLDRATIVQASLISVDKELPDPTIAGMVDFVESEARYYQKKKSHETD